MNPRMSVKNGYYINVPGILLAYFPKDSTNQCFFCEQQAMASGYAHPIKVFFFIANLFL